MFLSEDGIMGLPRSGFVVVLCLVPALLLSAVAGSAQAQGPAPVPSVASGPPPQFLAPSNPLAAPGSAYGNLRGSDTIPLSSGMFSPWLRRIPNLELGFLYTIGPNLSTGRLTADYLYPVSLRSGSVLFGEAHGEFQNFWKSPPVSTVSGPGFVSTNVTANDRTDLSFGGGFRTILGESAFIGVNGFYDTTRLLDQWYPSGSVGLEMAAIGPGDTAIDLTFNYYGNIFNSEGLRNAFRNIGGSWDVETGVSTPLFNDAFDLRVKLNAYQFNIGQSVFGWRTGADLTTRDAMFTVRYEHGNDPVNGPYDTIGGFMKAGFQVENIFRGQNPFTMPEPIFASPRNLWWLLTQKVKRNWHQPTTVVLTRTSASGPVCSLPIVRTIADTGVHGNCTDYFIPWDSGVGVSPECLALVSRIELTGYVVTTSACPNTQIFLFIAQDFSTYASSDYVIVYDLTSQIGPPVDFFFAASELATLNATANGIRFSTGGLCACTHRVTGMVITFYP